jgi:hypothetical protein
MDAIQSLDDAHLLIDTALANAMYAMHATFHSGLMTTPGALSFGRDMVMNIPLIADLTLICANRQRLIDERAISSNACCHSYDYQPGQEVLNLVHKPDKLMPRALIAVHTNGTLTIQLHAHTTLSEMINPFCKIELSGFYPYKVSTPVSSAQCLCQHKCNP